MCRAWVTHHAFFRLEFLKPGFTRSCSSIIFSPICPKNQFTCRAPWPTYVFQPPTSHQSFLSENLCHSKFLTHVCAAQFLSLNLGTSILPFKLTFCRILRPELGFLNNTLSISSACLKHYIFPHCAHYLKTGFNLLWPVLFWLFLEIENSPKVSNRSD